MMPKPRLDKQQIAVANIKLLLDASHSKKKDLAEYLGKVPQSLPKVRKTRPHPRPCPDAHIYAAMCAANDAERLMLRLGAEAGLRLSEIAAVHSRDVLEGDAGPSLIVRGKGDKQRIVPISEDLAKRITAAPGWLFPGRWRGHVEKSYVSRHLTRLLPDGWGPHSLRHRYATRMYETTHDLLLVSKLLGHSSVGDHANLRGDAG